MILAGRRGVDEDGTLGYAFLGGVDPAGNVAEDLRRTSQSLNNADATVRERDCRGGDVVARRFARRRRRRDSTRCLAGLTADPKVIEVGTLNAKRSMERVQTRRKGWRYVADSNVHGSTRGGAALIMGIIALPAATHAEGPSAYNVELRGSQPDMAALLGSYGLLALEEELYNDGRRSSRRFRLVRLVDANVVQPPTTRAERAELSKRRHVQRVLGNAARELNEIIGVRRLCPNRYYLREGPRRCAVTCTDVNDRLYKATGVQSLGRQLRYLASHQTGLPDGPLQIQQQLTTRDNRALPRAHVDNLATPPPTPERPSTSRISNRPRRTPSVPRLIPRSVADETPPSRSTKRVRRFAAKDTVVGMREERLRPPLSRASPTARASYPAVTNPTTSVVTRVPPR